MSTASTLGLASKFKETMAAVCSPVSIVTAMDGDRPHGTTVSAFASLSISPPMLLVSLDRGSDLLALIEHSRSFGVNILSAPQSDLALRFAKKGSEKFVGVDWQSSAGLPRLSGSAGWVACAVSDIVPGGDHMVVLGAVQEAESNSLAPLTYHARSFGTHHHHSETSR